MPREHAPVSQQPRVVEVVALARLDGACAALSATVRSSASSWRSAATSSWRCAGDSAKTIGTDPAGVGRHEKRVRRDARCAARSEATIAPFLGDQQWGDRGDRGCFRPQTMELADDRIGYAASEPTKARVAFDYCVFSSVSNMIGSATVFA